MSFHASSVALPPSAVLTVSTARSMVKYVARDVSRNGLWGRPLPGIATQPITLTASSTFGNTGDQITLTLL
jgi:hypothetical protein